MVEIPDSEYIYKADLVLIALGFTGPSKTLAKELALKMVKHSSTYLCHNVFTCITAWQKYFLSYCILLRK